MTDENKSKRRARNTYIFGSMLSVVGVLGALLQGVDWGVLMTPEAAAVAGSSVVLVRAVVAWVEKKRG